MKRRDFITLLSGATAWPLLALARAQQSDPVRRIGALFSMAPDDPLARPRIAAFEQALQALGWTVGRNLQIDYRWTAGDPKVHWTYATELLALKPMLILAHTGMIAKVLQSLTGDVPIVFVNVLDPTANGLVASFARPGGNITGFALSDFALAAKWLELLKQIAPRTTRVTVIVDPHARAGFGQLDAIEAIAGPMKTDVRLVNARDPSEIEHGIAECARAPHGGLIVTPSTPAVLHRRLIIALAARYELPAIHPFSYYAADGGLIAYGPDLVQQYRQAASYVDRIFRGEKPANLPVQAPTKYELVINLKTAEALKLAIPRALLAAATEFIE